MLSNYIDPNEMINNISPYIKSTSLRAAKSLAATGTTIEVFEGTKMELSEGMCESIYIDLLKELIEKNTLVGVRNCLSAMIIPVAKDEDGNVTFNIQLGISFP